MTLDDNYSGWCLGGNTIRISSVDEGDPNMVCGTILDISCAGKELYPIHYYPPCSLDISDIVDASVPQIPDAPEDTDDVITVLEDAEILENRKVRIYSGNDCVASFHAIPGAVSDYELREFSSRNTDVFKDRFLNKAACYFLTTRTTGRILRIKETEVSPLVFIAAEKFPALKVYEPLSGLHLTFDELPKGIYSLSLNALRRKFIEEHDLFPSVFRIWTGDVFTCSILITECECAKERHIVRFRNSLGVMERMEIVSPIKTSVDWIHEEDTFKQYDPSLKRMSVRRGRMIPGEILDMETNIKSPEEIRFVIDMIASQEVWLEDYYESPVRVIPETESLSFSLRQSTPETVKIKLKIYDSAIGYPDNQLNASLGLTSRVFSNHFNDRFR